MVDTLAIRYHVGKYTVVATWNFAVKHLQYPRFSFPYTPGVASTTLPTPPRPTDPLTSFTRPGCCRVRVDSGRALANGTWEDWGCWD